MSKRYKMTIFGKILVSFFIVVAIGVSAVVYINRTPIMENYKDKSLKDYVFKIYFEPNSAGISSSQSPVMRYIFRDLKKLEALGDLDWSSYKLYIIGNCSHRNSKYRSDSAAHDLAFDRASSISLDLVSYGIPEDSIVVTDNGNLNPSNYSNNDVCDIVLRRVYTEYNVYEPH